MYIYIYISTTNVLVLFIALRCGEIAEGVGAEMNSGYQMMTREKLLEASDTSLLAVFLALGHIWAQSMSVDHLTSFFHLGSQALIEAAKL